MTMHAITLRQPWAHAVAHFGKDVENRPRRPPAHLIGERVAIHVSKTWGINEYGIPLPAALLDWTRERCKCGDNGRLAAPPDAGRLVATARLVGWVSKAPVTVTRAMYETLDPECDLPIGEEIIGFSADWKHDSGRIVVAQGSPWFTGPVGWVLADVRPLAVPVGQTCDECGGDGCRDIDDGGNGRACCCGGSGQMAIRGALYPFQLSPEVEAAVLRQEEGNG